MPLLFNGNEPSNITFNGNEVDIVVYNGVTVWEKEKEEYYKIYFQANSGSDITKLLVKGITGNQTFENVVNNQQYNCSTSDEIVITFEKGYKGALYIVDSTTGIVKGYYSVNESYTFGSSFEIEPNHLYRLAVSISAE